MSEYEQIIVEVKSGLTESKEQNYKYLLEQSEKYKQHPMAHEILKEIGRLLYDNLPADGKENFSNAMDNDIRKLNKKIDEANDNIVKGNFNKAKELLNEYLEAFLNMYKEDQITRYFTFSDIVEFYCSKNKLKIDKKVVWVDMRADDAYKLLAYISSEEKKFDKSFEYLEKGLYFNPMSLGIRFEKAETYKMQRNLDKMYDAIREIYPYIYDQSNLSRYYRLLRYYYIEKEKYDLAYSLFAISIYYENDQMAHNEINYIRQRLGNPKYELSTKEIIGILKRENIPMTILEENLIQLKNFSNEIEVIKKQPKLVDKIKERIILFSNEINEDEEIKGLRITIPKITTEDIYDEKKLILDDNDKNRIAKNIEILKQNNIPFVENLKNIPFNSCTSLKSKEEILGRLLVDYAVATCALYSLEGKANIIESVINQMDQKLQIKKVLSEEDNVFLKGMYEEKVPKQKLQDITWLFEECAVFTWVLGLLDKPQSKNECNVSVLDELFFNTESYEQLLSKCNLKSKEEVLEFADLIFRYNWACIESRMQGQQLSQLNGMIVQEQKRALEWVLDWKIEKLMKEKINIKFKKDNFDFSFETPSSLHINNITNPNDLTLLFSLANEKGERVLTLHNLGPCNSATRIDNFYEHDVEKYKKDNWNIVGEYNVSSYNLGSNIKQLVAYKTTPEVKDYIFGLCLYYFVLNGHIVLLEVVVDENLDYSVIDNVMNFKNNMLAANVLFSIKENKSDSQLNQTVDMARNLNYRLHAEQLSIPVLNNFVVENPEEPQIVFSASNQAFIQQLVSDGPLESNETFEQRLNFVVKDTINFMKAHNKENTDKSF